LLGAYLKSVRLEKEWTLREAAQHLGMSYGYISGAEKEEYQPKLPQLKRFSEGYGISLDKLLEYCDAATLQSKAEAPIDVDLSPILFIELKFSMYPCNLEFHAADQSFMMTLSFQEYMKFEDEIEGKGFLRTDSGVLVNLMHIKAISPDKRYIYFNNDCTGKRASLAALPYSMMKGMLDLQVQNNQNLSTEISVKPEGRKNLYSILRNKNSF
jgi:transcriptional regulator with XRE-family HTH domain